MTEKERAIKAIEKLIRVATNQFKKAEECNNYSRMSSLDSYIEGLGQALEVVKLIKEEK